MTEHSICPDCGAALPTGATAGLCPKCLLAGAFESSDEAPAVSPYAATTPQPGGFVPPAAAVLAPYFPGLEILEILGHGGMGAVYKARQTKLDRIVALKIIRPESADDPAFAERFTREARTLARLSHPNIVAIHDFGETNVRSDPLQRVTTNVFFFVMEYIDGANLRQVLQAGSLQPAQALAIVPQICDALQYAHDEGIIHRDIKPENILIDRRGRVKIADFGLAKLAPQSAENFTLTGTHQVMGTPRYMAPEQMEGSHLVDHRADIYSLGVVFYEMLTGELPLGRFDPPSHKAAVDARLDDVVHRALAKEPSHRYQRASEIRRDVDAVVLDVLSHGGAESLAGEGSVAAGFPGPSTILERQVAGVVNWIRGAPPSRDESHPLSLSTADRENIQRKVRAPGIALLLYGVLLLLPAALLFTNGFDIADGNDGMPWGVGVAMIVGSLCVIAISALVVRGAWHLLSLEGLRPALLGSILGQPIGIWALIVLSRPDVKAAFAVPPRSSAEPLTGWLWNTTTWEALACIGAVLSTFLPWGRIAGGPGAPGTEFTASGMEWPPDGVPPAIAAVVLLVLLLATAGIRPKPVWRSAIIMGVAVVWLVCGINFVGAMQNGGLSVQPLLDAANWDILNNGHRVGTVYEARSTAAIFAGSGPYWLMGFAVALMSAAAVDLGRTLRSRAAATMPIEQGRHAGQVRTPVVPAGQSPVARVGFTVPRHDDVGAHVKFHFGELGYRLVRDTAGEWIFERGRKSAAILESNIRAYHMTLTVRCLPLGDAGQRVSCTWVVATLGLAHIGRRDVAALEAEGRELEALLRPAAMDTHSSGAQEGQAAPLEAAPPFEASPGGSSASMQASFPDLDLHRIQMELKAPAGALLIVALLHTFFWCAVGGALFYDEFLHPGQVIWKPELLAMIGGTLAFLLAAGTLVHGALHLRRMTGYEWCIAGCVVAMVPWSAAALIGLPVGIWAFRTLRRADVRDAFLKRSLELERSQRRRPSRSGRDWVTFTRDQADNDDLPDVCMVCGAPARERVNKTFHHAPDWAGLLLLAGIIPGAVALAVTSRAMRVACPVCHRHRGHWSRLEWMNLLGGLLVLVLGAIGYGVGMVLRVPHREGPPEPHWIGLVVGAMVGLIAWIAPIIYLTTTRINARKITLHEITFQGVAPEFARAAARHAAGPQPPGRE